MQRQQFQDSDLGILKTNDRFVIDKDIEDKLLITVAPDGYLRCVKER